MGITMGRRVEMDPLVGFNFVVEIDGLIIGRFNGVDGLDYEVEMIEYRASDTPNLPRFRQGRKKAARITLKRGVLVGGKENILLGWLREVESKTITRRNISISVGRYNVDETNNAKQRSWELLNCAPTKWSMGNLDSNANNPLIETIEFVVEEVTQSK